MPLLYHSSPHHWTSSLEFGVPWVPSSFLLSLANHHPLRFHREQFHPEMSYHQQPIPDLPPYQPNLEPLPHHQSNRETLHKYWSALFDCYATLGCVTWVSIGLDRWRYVKPGDRPTGVWDRTVIIFIICLCTKNDLKVYRKRPCGVPKKRVSGL